MGEVLPQARREAAVQGRASVEQGCVVEPAGALGIAGVEAAGAQQVERAATVGALDMGLPADGVDRARGSLPALRTNKRTLATGPKSRSLS